MIRIIE
jgi:hypothetical protein